MDRSLLGANRIIFTRSLGVRPIYRVTSGVLGYEEGRGRQTEFRKMVFNAIGAVIKGVGIMVGLMVHTELDGHLRTNIVLILSFHVKSIAPGFHDPGLHKHRKWPRAAAETPRDGNLPTRGWCWICHWSSTRSTGNEWTYPALCTRHHHLPPPSPANPNTITTTPPRGSILDTTTTPVPSVR